MKHYTPQGLENMRKRAWDAVLYEEDQFLYTLKKAEKEQGEEFKLKYWVKLEDIHEKYDYWRIYPKTDATLEDIEKLEETRQSINMLNRELKEKLSILFMTRDKTKIKEEERKKKKSTKPKRKVCKRKK